MQPIYTSKLAEYSWTQTRERQRARMLEELETLAAIVACGATLLLLACQLVGVR